MKKKYNFEVETVNFRINKFLNAELLKFNMLTSETHFTTNKYYYRHNNALPEKNT